MGLLGSVFGTPETTTDVSTENSYAVLLNADLSDTPTVGNGVNYALELDAAGYDVQLFLDGEVTKWPAEVAENPDRPFSME